MSKYTGTDIAPYMKFRASAFFGDVFANGSFTGDISGCNWTCHGCWSGAGYRNRVPAFELTAAQAAERLLKGMTKVACGAARISGGECTMHWAHTRGLIDEFLERTRGLVIDVPKVTLPGGEPLVLILETHGALLDDGKLLAIEADWGREARRVFWSLGLKATDGEKLGELTGLPKAVADRNHQRQLNTLLLLAGKCEHQGVFANFLDRYTDPAVYAEILRECEKRRPGIGHGWYLQRMKTYPNANRYFTPKRERKG